MPVASTRFVDFGDAGTCLGSGRSELGRDGRQQKAPMKRDQRKQLFLLQAGGAHLIPLLCTCRLLHLVAKRVP